MLVPRRVSVLLLTNGGLASNSHLTGKSQEGTLRGSKHWQSKFFSASSLPQASATITYSFTQTIKAPSAPWPRVGVQTFTSIFQSVTHTPLSLPSLWFPPSSTFLLPITLQTPSHVERWVLSLWSYKPPSHSQKSSNLFSSMPVSYSFRPAWDARKKTKEVQPTHALPLQPIPPSKLPKAPLSLSCLSFPSSAPNSDCSIPTVPSPITSNTFLSPIALNSCTHSSSFVLSVPAHNDLLDTHTVESAQFSHSYTAALPNSYHRHFSSTLNSSLAPPAMPILSTRAPQLEFPTYLRPPVLAANHLLSWTTPYAQQQWSDLESKLPLDLVNKAYHVVHSSLAPATRSSYGAGLLRFIQFCDSWRIDEQDCMPASAALLTAFISQCAGFYLEKTIKSWLAALRSWHIENQAPWNGDDEWVQLARVSGNKQGTAFKCALRAPLAVSLDHLRFLRSKLDITTSFHAVMQLLTD